MHVCLHVCSMQILQENRLGWKVSKPAPFQFKLDRITAELEKKHHVHGDWHAAFTGASEVCQSSDGLTIPWVLAADKRSSELCLLKRTTLLHVVTAIYLCPAVAVQSCAI